MVKPGGTGRPRFAISARLAPLPPSRSRMSALPSALPSPNVNTHLPDFAASSAGLLATNLLPDFGAGLAGLFFNALRAGGAGLARPGAGRFDFVAVFFGLDAALAMTASNPREERRFAPYTILGVPAKPAKRVWSEMGSRRCSARGEAISTAQGRSSR